jgi:uncharacterized membrane protein
MPVPVLLGKISQYILNPIITLGFVVATIVFFYGIVKFIQNADDDTKREEGKKSIIYGIVGFVVMFSVYGIIKFVLNTLGIPNAYPSILP